MPNMDNVINLLERRMAKMEKEAATKIADDGLEKLTRRQSAVMKKTGEVPFTAADAKAVKALQDVNEEVDLSMFKGKKSLHDMDRISADAVESKFKNDAAAMGRDLKGPTKDITQDIENDKLLKRMRDVEYNPANEIPNNKIKITRYGGKTREIKNPISQDFENAFSKEFNDVTTNQKGFVPVDANLRNTLNVDTALDNLKGKGYSSDVNKFNNMVNSAKDFRQKVRDGNVVFEAGDVKVTKRTNKFSENMDGFLKKAVPVAVGGGLVFSMFSRGGQMSNSELYGQQQQYGGGGY